MKKYVYSSLVILLLASVSYVVADFAPINNGYEPVQIQEINQTASSVSTPVQHSQAKQQRSTATEKEVAVRTGRKNDVISIIYKQDIRNHAMTHFNYISRRVKNKILNTVFESADKYKLNPLVIYGVIVVESKLRYWIEHKPVTITVQKNGKRKRIRTKAIGLGGVIWEIWGDDLIQEGITETKSDLYDPEINIYATAFILNKLKKLNQLKGTATPTESALLRYYGVVYRKDGTVSKTYFQTVSAVIYDVIKKPLFSKRS